MGILTFSADDIRSKVWPEFMLRPLDSTSSESSVASVMLVHNQGVYLMATSYLPESSPEKSIAYAQGCDPSKDVDWYQTSRELVGADDFCQPLPPEWFERAILEEYTVVRIEVTENDISFVEIK
ncbi:DUF3085 domain-containing protein [Photobacterium sp. SDRW27]|uniref:DUF3085 domain-containing protein n=1 Tax=Photobacterium obscurum TaxID=2829490 RepID=UPI00224472C0|nr:DUF3085 domain-containing protein [Photobacterium obscurum]MCW8332016.1 DUF3085 domain-containing protein [Photobacterium obscurum]